MVIAIRKESNGLIYIDKTALERFDKETLKQPPYNYSFVDVEKEDCEASDFNNDFSFNLEKYNKRKNLNRSLERQLVIKKRLEELTKDFIQYYLGATIENIEERKAEFISLHNELRELLGKQPRIYK